MISLEEIGKLHRDLLVGPGRIGDVQPAGFVEVSRDRPINQRRSGHLLDRKAFREREVMAAQIDGVRRRLFRLGDGSQEDCGEN